MAVGIQRSLKAGLRRHRLLEGDVAFCPLTGVEVAMESDFGVTCKQQGADLGVGHGPQPSRADPDAACSGVRVAMDLQERSTDVPPCSCLLKRQEASCKHEPILR